MTRFYSAAPKNLRAAPAATTSTIAGSLKRLPCRAEAALKSEFAENLNEDLDAAPLLQIICPPTNLLVNCRG